MVKNKLNKKLGRVGAGLLSALLIAGTYSTKTVYADDNKATTVEKENTLPVIEVSQQDLNPLDTIKSLVIQERAAFDGTYDLTNISIEKSVADIEGFNRSVTGIQTVTVKVTLASTGDIEAQKTLGYSFIQKAVVNVVNSTAPVIKLKNSSVVVNNGDTFNASSYISYINDDSGILPVLTVEGSVDMNTDGDYPVTYTVVDTAGNKFLFVLLRKLLTQELRLKNNVKEKKLKELLLKKLLELNKLRTLLDLLLHLHLIHLSMIQVYMLVVSLLRYLLLVLHINGVVQLQQDLTAQV